MDEISTNIASRSSEYVGDADFAIVGNAGFGVSTLTFGDSALAVAFFGTPLKARLDARFGVSTLTFGDSALAVAFFGTPLKARLAACFEREPFADTDNTTMLIATHAPIPTVCAGVTTRWSRPTRRLVVAIFARGASPPRRVDVLRRPELAGVLPSGAFVSFARTVYDARSTFTGTRSI
jgi:hypothetical protein